MTDPSAQKPAQKPAQTAPGRVDEGLARAGAALADPLPSVPDLRARAGRIALARQQIDGVFAGRLAYAPLRDAVRRITRDARTGARRAEAAHRRLRRRLFWHLAWVRYQYLVWTFLGLAVLAGLAWPVWLWRAEILALVLPVAPPQTPPQTPPQAPPQTQPQPQPVPPAGAAP
ncbi:MAG: hypothetical protein ACT4OK_15495 [Gemmobacter sp.]